MERVKANGRFLTLAGAALIVGGGLLSAGGAFAHEAEGHPAKIHEGTCDALGKVAWPLNGVGGTADLGGTPVPTTTMVNDKTAYQMMMSDTELKGVKLSDLTDTPHVIMVYENDETFDGILCGTIGGVQRGDELATGLAEINQPGHTGVALFTTNDDGVDVQIFVGHGLSGVSAQGVNGGMHADDDHHDATPEASPAAN